VVKVHPKSDPNPEPAGY